MYIEDTSSPRVMVNVPVARLACKPTSSVLSGVCEREPELSSDHEAADFLEIFFAGPSSIDSAFLGRVTTNRTTINTSPATTATQVQVLIRLVA